MQIVKAEEKKGVLFSDLFFPDLKIYKSKLKRLNRAIKKLKAKIRYSKDEEQRLKYTDQRTRFYDRRRKVKEEEEEKITSELDQISQRVRNGDFKFNLREVKKVKGKATYSILQDPSAYLINKQLQRNLNKLYKVKQSNRNAIISQLTLLLKDGLPKQILRTDIENFYESINTERLMNKLNDDPLLTPLSKKILKRLLREYNLISRENRGIPRGVGVSAYLAEIYMRTFDNHIKNLDEVVFYARYVDDIVVVFIPRPNSNTDYIDIVNNQLNNLDLKLNSNKTKHLKLPPTGKALIFEYLGYDISCGASKDCLEISLSQKKINKYKKRVEIAFNSYINCKDKKFANKKLTQRIKFLTRNTRLFGNKMETLIGIFFSNQALTNLSVLNDLDAFLQEQINRYSLPPRLKKKLLESSFYKGFTAKHFFKIKSSKELESITKVWQYVEA